MGRGSGWEAKPVATLNALIVVGNPLACAKTLGGTSGSRLCLGDLRKLYIDLLIGNTIE